MIAGDEFGLGFRQIEGQPVRLRKHRDGEGDERDEDGNPEQDLRGSRYAECVKRQEQPAMLDLVIDDAPERFRSPQISSTGTALRPMQSS